MYATNQIRHPSPICVCIKLFSTYECVDNMRYEKNHTTLSDLSKNHTALSVF